VRFALTSPKVVVAVSWKVTATEPADGVPVGVGPLVEELGTELRSCPVWIAIALRAGTVADSTPPETESLLVELRQCNSMSTVNLITEFQNKM
jgi:hypothetical protein